MPYARLKVVFTVLALTSVIASAFLLAYVPEAGRALGAGGQVVSSDGWGQQYPVPPGNHLDGISGTSSSDVFAVGDKGTILHYDGSSWKSMFSGTRNWIHAVWCASPSDVFGVGDNGTIVHYDGWCWSPMSSGTEEALSDVWGASSSDVFAVGLNGTILHYDGSVWTSMSSGTGNGIRGVWGASASDVFAVGENGTALRYQGSEWEEMDSGTSHTLYAVWGGADNDMFAVGTGGTVIHFDGSSWSAMTTGTTMDLFDVWGNSSSEVYAVILGGNTILYYDGSTWTEGDLVRTWSMLAVWGTSAYDMFAVGGGGTILHSDGSAVTVMAGGGDWQRAIWGSSSSDVFAVGFNGSMLHYDGSAWSTMVSGTTEDLWGVWGASSDNIFAVGGNGTILHYDGSSWTPMASGTTNWLMTVWGYSSSDVWAAGNGGTVLHYDGSNWSAMPSAPAAPFGMWGLSSSDLYAAGAVQTAPGVIGGRVCHWNGSTWTAVYTGPSRFYSIWGASASDIFAVGDNGAIIHYDGSLWSEMPSGVTQALWGVWGSSASDVFAAAGAPGAILHYDGSSWEKMSTSHNSNVNGVWGTSADDVFATAGAGVILHYKETAAPLPTVTSVEPSQGYGGQTMSVTINGANLGYATAVGFGPGIRVNGYTINSATQVVVSITMTDDEAAIGIREVSIANPEGITTLPDGFTILDGSPPSTPVVNDDGNYTASTTQLHAAWTSSDAQSGIAEYQYAIGTSAGAADLAGWTSAGTSTEVTRTGLSLPWRTTCYFSVMALNGSGLWSAVGTSNGITVSDATPPSAPVVTDDGAATSSTVQLHASWTASQDPDSGISEYQYAIGTTAGGTDVVGWTSAGTVTEVTRTGLSLSWGTTYYFAVKAINGSGTWSEAGSSDGIAVSDATAPTTPAVTDDGEYTTSTSQLHAVWSASDGESGIVEYLYAIGTTSGGTDVVDWTSTGTTAEVTKTGITVAEGKKYYFSVKARNGSDVWSEVGTSDGIVVIAEGSAQKDISSVGGTVQTTDSKIAAVIPSDALTGTATVTIKQVATSSAEDAPKGFKMGGTCFIIEAVDTNGNVVVTFSQPVVITVKYTDEDVDAAGGDPNDLVLSYWDEEAEVWQPLDTTVDTAHKTVSATTTHFSKWAILAKAGTSSNGLPGWTWAVIGIGALAVLAAAAFVVSRKLAPQQ